MKRRRRLGARWWLGVCAAGPRARGRAVLPRRLLAWAVAWVLIGGVPAAAQDEEGEGSEGENPPEVLGAPSAFGADASGETRVAIPAGAPLRAEARPGAQVLSIIDAETELLRIERRGDWVRVRYLGLRGWVWIGEGRPADRTEEGGDAREDGPDDAPAGESSDGRSVDSSRTAPDDGGPGAGEEAAGGSTLLIPAAGAADAGDVSGVDLAAKAREVLGERATESEAGSWTLLTDVEDRELVASLGRLASEVQRSYGERFGLEAASEPKEAVVVLFGRKGDFTELPGARGVLSRLQVREGGGPDVAVLCRCDLADEDLRFLFVHEVGRLLNRRVLGPRPPAWIDEGLAYALAFGRIEPSGAFDPEHLGGSERLVSGPSGAVGAEGATEASGGRAAVRNVQRAVERGRLAPPERLVSSDWQDGADPWARRERIVQTALFVWFLLDDEDGRWRDGFEAYLHKVAGGGPAGSDALLEHLETDWKTLERRFRRWIDLQLRWLDR